MKEILLAMFCLLQNNSSFTIEYRLWNDKGQIVQSGIVKSKAYATLNMGYNLNDPNRKPYLFQCKFRNYPCEPAPINPFFKFDGEWVNLLINDKLLFHFGFNGIEEIYLSDVDCLEKA